MDFFNWDTATIAVISTGAVTALIVALRLKIRWTPRCTDNTSLRGKTVLITAYQGPKKRNSQGVDSVLMTNFLAPYALTRCLLCAKELDTRNLRVINVTSGSYTQNKLHFHDMGCNSRPYEIYQAYGESKLALLLFSLSLPSKAAELDPGRDIVSIAVHPGAVNTDLMRNWPGLFGKFLRFLAALCFRSVEQGASSVVYAIVTDRGREFSEHLLTDCAIKHFHHINKNKEDFDRLWDYADGEYRKMLQEFEEINANK